MIQGNWDSRNIPDQTGRTVIVTGANSGLASFLNPFFAQNTAMGALPLYAACGPVQSKDYFGPGGRFEVKGYPKQVRASSRSQNKEIGDRLWQMSEKLTGVPF